MRLLYKQKMFSRFDSYDVFDESVEKLYTVKGKLSLGHCLNVYDSVGRELGSVK